MNASEAQTLLSTFDPVLQEAGEAVASELPIDPEEKKKFSIFILLGAIASILTIINYCKNRDMSGVALKESIGTLTAHDRRLMRHRVRRSIRESGEYHGHWDLKQQANEMLAAVLRAGGKAEPGRIEAVVGAAMRQAETSGEA